MIEAATVVRPIVDLGLRVRSFYTTSSPYLSGIGVSSDKHGVLY